MWNKRQRVPLKHWTKGMAALKNEQHSFWLGDNSDSSRMVEQGGRNGGAEWGQASTSREMILLSSAHPIMICAHASIHADSRKLWAQMMHRTTLSLFFWLSCFLIFSLSLLCPRFSISLQFPPLALTVCLWICSASTLCSPISCSYILHLLIRAHLMQAVPGVGRTSGAARGVSAQ